MDFSVINIIEFSCSEFVGLCDQTIEQLAEINDRGVERITRNATEETDRIVTSVDTNTTAVAETTAAVASVDAAVVALGIDLDGALITQTFAIDGAIAAGAASTVAAIENGNLKLQNILQTNVYMNNHLANMEATLQQIQTKVTQIWECLGCGH